MIERAGEMHPASALPRLRAAVAGSAVDLPERVLQFGEGNFLRAFVDWMLQRMNAQGLFGGRAVVVQPIASGMAQVLNEQDGLFTVVLRGVVEGRLVDTRELVASVSRALDPYASWDAFIGCAENPALRFVVSNTTEAGIRLDPGDALEARPAPSFPGKLTQLLHARFRWCGGDPARGLVMLPCELIERNGEALRQAVDELARRWRLEPAFVAWLDGSCVFTNTLVDRIVSGYPRRDAAALGARLGYEDRLLVAAEPFHSWIIEGPRTLADELPLVEAGLQVVFTDDLTPYRDRKVRILNGAHTMTALAAYLAGLDTVRALMEDELLSAFLRRGIAEEILPALVSPPAGSTTRPLPAAELQRFADQVVERFRNPFIEHDLLSISLSSLSKYKVRLLPTVIDGVASGRGLPARLCFALAALCAFYRGHDLHDGALVGTRGGSPYPIRDQLEVLTFFREAWEEAGPRPSPAASLTLVRHLLARVDFWGSDLTQALPGFVEAVARSLDGICSEGVRAGLSRLA